ncbi:MAG: hypothetical protein JST48_09730 [Bacteroidetes bacterium]|nr:hypothetical protein [Bacteroidota bacterium]
MKSFYVVLFFLFPLISVAQIKFEVTEFSGRVTSIEPGANFALSRMNLDVNGEIESFRFYPSYGKLFSQKIKPGDVVTVKAEVNPNWRTLYKNLDKTNKKFSWYIGTSNIVQIKIGSQWMEVKEPQHKKSLTNYKIFLDKKVVEKYNLMDVDKGVIFEHGLVGYNYWMVKLFADQTKKLKKGDLVSFYGYPMKYEEGYQYPIKDVSEVYSLIILKKEIAELQSFLFKQNHVCIGAKFKKPDGSEFIVSFPAEEAQRVHSFLKPNTELKVYYGREYPINLKYNMPELHAVIQDADTLLIEQFNFFGGADGDHQHADVELKGKITKINKTDRGNVMSVIVASEYYIEIDALMAQQLGTLFHKGKEIIVAGKERVKKIGEIYNKDYRIVTPEKIQIDGKLFQLYHP